MNHLFIRVLLRVRFLCLISCRTLRQPLSLSLSLSYKIFSSERKIIRREREKGEGGSMSRKRRCRSVRKRPQRETEWGRCHSVRKRPQRETVCPSVRQREEEAAAWDRVRKMPQREEERRKRAGRSLITGCLLRLFRELRWVESHSESSN